MLITPSDMTLAMNVTMVKKPNTTQAASLNIHRPDMMLMILTGMLMAETRMSAALRPRTRALEGVRRERFEQTMYHREKFPTKAMIHMAVSMAASRALSNREEVGCSHSEVTGCCVHVSDDVRSQPEVDVSDIFLYVEEVVLDPSYLVTSEM